MSPLLPQISQWLAQHPYWAGFFVFCLAFAESLALIGLLVPGVAVLFAVGALIGLGVLPFESMCLWAIAGAVAGDGLSFWLGRRFKHSLRRWWPFRRHPEWLQRGVRFFRRYGALGILLGRFVGPVRAVVPLAAGMMAMPAGRFALVNVVSALLWAPAYLLPGMVFGASLELAARVAGRLAVLVVAFTLSLWLGIWLTLQLYRFFRARVHRLLLLWFDFNRHHPLVAALTGPLLDPRERDYLALVSLGLLWLLGFWVLERLLPPGPWLSLVFLHTIWSDAFFQAVLRLASWPVLLGVGAVLTLWLLGRRRDLETWHWLINLGFCVAWQTLHIGDVVLVRGSVIYGFLGVMVAAQLRRPAWGYGLLGGWWLTLTFARLYLGGLPLNRLVLSLAGAVGWLVIAGVGYRRHHRGRLGDLRWLALPLVLLLLGALFWQQSRVSSPPAKAQVWSQAAWQRQGWRALPQRRQDLFGGAAQPLPLQWGASLPDIVARLRPHGWRPARSWRGRDWLRWLTPEVDLTRVPVLPRFHAGRPEALVLLKAITGDGALVLRLWASGFRLADGQTIWVGAVGRLRLQRAFGGWLWFATEADGFDPEALQVLLADVQAAGWCAEARQAQPPLWLVWDCR